MAREIAFFSSGALPAFIVTVNDGMRVSLMMKDGRAGHPGLTERPILNELNVIVSEGAFKPRLRPPRG
jgi:hypothetical protein